MLTSVLLLIIGIIGMFDLSIFSNPEREFASVYGLLFAASAGGFIAIAVVHSAKKSLCASFFACSTALIFSIATGGSYGILLSLLTALLFAYFAREFDLVPLVLSCGIVSVVVSILLSLLYDPFLSLTAYICHGLEKWPSLAGVVTNIYSTLFSNEFSDIMFSRDYTGSAFIDGKVFSGIINIFHADQLAGGERIHFLTGKYFVNIFVSLGMFLSLFSRYEGDIKICFFITLVLSVIVGDNSMLSVFLLLYNPFLYIGYLFMVFVSYFVPGLVKLYIGYTDNAGIAELFKYCSDWIYFLLVGVVIMIMTYYLAQLILSKLDFDSHTYYPPGVKKLVKALGGVRNIQYIDHGKLYVVNPNLINILKVDCEIHENEITLIQNDLDLLQDYF